MAVPDDLDRSELEAVIETRRELGATYEPALVDSFVDKVEKAIATRVDAGIAAQASGGKAEAERGHRQFVLGIVSLGTGIPITAVAGGTAELPGVIVAWTGIVAVNVAAALRGRRAH